MCETAVGRITAEEANDLLSARGAVALEAEAGGGDQVAEEERGVDGRARALGGEGVHGTGVYREDEECSESSGDRKEEKAADSSKYECNRGTHDSQRGQTGR